MQGAAGRVTTRAATTSHSTPGCPVWNVRWTGRARKLRLGFSVFTRCPRMQPRLGAGSAVQRRVVGSWSRAKRLPSTHGHDRDELCAWTARATPATGIPTILLPWNCVTDCQLLTLEARFKESPPFMGAIQSLGTQRENCGRSCRRFRAHKRSFGYAVRSRTLAYLRSMAH